MLAPDRKIVEELLVNFLQSYQSITLAAISLQQSQFLPLNPAPEWMTNLQNNLGQAQSLSTDWLINKGPVVIAQTPQYYSTYSSSMQIVANQIQNATTKDQAVQALLWLQKHIQAIPSSEVALQEVISKFGSDFKPFRTSVETALTDAANDVKKDQAATKELSDKINQLYQDIAAETAKASAGMNGIPITGISLSFGIIAFTFAVATAASPIFPIVGVVLAIGGLTISSITVAVNDAKIEENLKTLAPLQAQLLDENQAIAVLQSLQPMLQNVDTALLGIRNALDMSSIWTDESNKLNDAIAGLQNYNDSNFKTMPEIASIATAAKAWNDIACMATNVQRAASGMSNVGVFNFSQS